MFTVTPDMIPVLIPTWTEYETNIKALPWPKGDDALLAECRAARVRHLMWQRAHNEADALLRAGHAVTADSVRTSEELRFARSLHRSGIMAELDREEATMKSLIKFDNRTVTVEYWSHDRDTGENSFETITGLLSYSIYGWNVQTDSRRVTFHADDVISIKETQS